MFAQGTLTTIGNAITTNGSYYGSTIVGTNLTGTLDTANAATAITELADLTNSLNNTVDGLSGIGLTTRTDETVTFTPGYYYGTGAFTDSTIRLDGSNNPNAVFIFKGPAFTFTDCTFQLQNGALATNIFWVADAGVTVDNTNVFGTVICNAFTYTNSAARVIVINGHIFSRGAMTLTRSGPGELTINSSGSIPGVLPTDYTPSILVNPLADPVVCYAKGTLILTKRGYVPIEKIKAGHKVITQGKIVDHVLQPKVKVSPVVWASSFTSEEAPICISKNSFGENYPFQDLHVSPDHCMLIHGKTVRAKFLVNDTTIYKTKCDEVVYYHLECEKHSAIVANGVLSESYVDLDNRHVFEESDRIQPRKFMPVSLGLR